MASLLSIYGQPRNHGDLRRSLEGVVELHCCDINPRLRAEIEDHLRQCHRCSVLHDSIKKVLYIVGTGVVPSGYGESLHKFLTARMGA